VIDRQGVHELFGDHVTLMSSILLEVMPFAQTQSLRGCELYSAVAKEIEV